MSTLTFDHKKIEEKWQRKWRESGIYKSDNNKENKYYLLVELTYTSGDLHMGHWFAWCAPDAYARMMRMKGENVLFPVGGFDAFGLPAENAAIKHGIHPREWTYKNIETMRKQFEKMGPSFDWDKEVITSDADYYRWTQWLFIELYKKGLAYRGKVLSNWCPECKTVLANEHVQNGCCWRHTSTPVEQKQVDQWMVSITKYADRLIWPKKSSVDWPDALRDGQNNWIGRSEGALIDWEIVGNDKKITTFTTRLDTIFGVKFLVLSPDHPLIKDLAKGKEVLNYLTNALTKTERDRKKGESDKTGVDTGYKVRHPFTDEEIPVWIADFVLGSYGTGAIMGVPSHDTRDWDFAKQYNLGFRQVIEPQGGGYRTKDNRIEHFDGSAWVNLDIYEGEGKLFNSDEFTGLSSDEAKTKILTRLKAKKIGKASIQYHLRDWSISRQRYWAAPVPVIYCEHCIERISKDKRNNLIEGKDYAVIDSKIYLIHTVPEKDLPVVLPENVDYMPTGKPPLATAQDWVKTTCPECGGQARRDVETLDTYVDSSWYFFRYLSPDYDKGLFDKDIIKAWMPIKIYFGGPEHILGHTLYARFITKFLFDLGIINFDEFALKRIHHGVIFGPDGYRMSKSRGNVVNPDVQVEKFGADSVRLYINFLGPHDKGGAWKTEGMEGARRFLNRVWKLVNSEKVVIEDEKVTKDILRIQNKTIKKVSKDIEILHTHTAIASIMEFTNFLEDLKQKSKNQKSKSKIKCAQWDNAVKTLVLLLAPFAPHMTEELWGEVLGEEFSIHRTKWPLYSKEFAQDEETTLIIQINGKVRGFLKLKSGQPQNKDKIAQLAMDETNVKKWVSDKKVINTVFVPGKLINFVTS